MEIIPYAVEAYNSMFDNNYKPQNVLDWNLKVDLLISGSPCVDFSKAGKNDINSGRSLLYYRTLEIIREELTPRPKYVIWENVKGLVSKKHIHHFQHYLHKMESYGYTNYHNILNALDFGIPQTRDRVFVISIRNDIPQYFNFNNLKKIKTRPLTDYLEDIPLNEWINAGNRFIEFGNFYTFPRASDGKLINGSYNRAWKIDKYIGTIPTYNIPRIAKIVDGNLFYRQITTKEAWSLMGFDDDDYNNVLEVSNAKSNLYTLAGNSIVVPVLEAIFRELLLK